jgi:hypothetical protein
MREFKFIRGKYTNENIFNSDETKACLFAYDRDGELVQFTEKNNKEFQDKFAGLSSGDRLSEIYTLRPSQFTISATKEVNNYSFTFNANEMTYDNSEIIPENVRKAAESYIKSKTTAHIKTTDNVPKLNLEGNTIEKTTVEFTFGKKTFTRNLVFKVSGTLEESGYLLANGENVTAYSDIANTDNPKTGVFYNGHFQIKVQSQSNDVVSNSLEVTNKGNLNVATSYTTSENFIFVVNGQIKNSVDYSDNLEFLLYTKTRNSGNTITENGITYYYVGKCTVMSRNNKIVKGYETSYAGKYVLKDSKLIQVTESDLTKNKLAIYSSDEYHIIGNNVYEDDSSDTEDYFMHIDNKNPLVKNITNENAYVNEKGVVSPLITDNIFRQITSVNVTATQSD